MGVDEETTSTHVQDRPPMGGGGMAISPQSQDMALERPKGSAMDTRTAGGLQSTEGEGYDLPGLHGLSSEVRVEAISTMGPYGESKQLPESRRRVPHPSGIILRRAVREGRNGNS